MMHRMLAFFLALALAATLVPSLAEDLDDTVPAAGSACEDLDDEPDDYPEEYPDEDPDDSDEPEEDLPAELTEEELAALLALDAVDEDEEPVFVVGEVYHEPDRTEFNAKSPAIYTCRVAANHSVFAERNNTSERLFTSNKAYTAEVLDVGSAYVVVRTKNGTIGYVKRDWISNVKAIDPGNTVPYGVQKAIYICTTATQCHVRKSMSDQDDCWVVLNPGTALSIWKLQDGWAVVPYWRTYGYIDLNELTDLIPVSPTDANVSSDTPIAAYTSYYNMSQDDINKSRLVNIDVACKYLTRVMQPGESFNFNKNVGPYRPNRGYQQAWVLVDGVSKPGYGGGTCQVSSTLYNALLQLPGITILQRRPHGPSGAKYLPHGVDAAVGNSSLNLRFRNDYDFPIRIEGHTSYDGALLMVVYRADALPAGAE